MNFSSKSKAQDVEEKRKAASDDSIATYRMPPLGGPGNTHLGCVYRRQVFGLANSSAFAEFLLTVASRSQFLAISAQ
jgi:hypothetical protein